ncbi:SGNH/GDSL hydrolase family protein [Phytoactinopolyspora limicola]|uniref:SGNH/GDSL hydrolase family protein n=1 Tax=Phytoactinopolyspora limicola TaxID=2715536 RepID=UPI00140E53EE|nr:SGNH/GDSL hydrolase family protein [Phytoactinopolyspora limicola]
MRLVTIGDSFSEGVGDEQADGTLRGWADLVASGLAAARDAPIEYANLAIRGNLMTAIVAEQLEPALALKPTVLTLNGGGNDILRPRADLDRIGVLTAHVITRCLASGVHPVVLSAANPTPNLPMGRRMQRLGDQLTSLAGQLTTSRGATFVNVWADTELTRPEYWHHDRLHLNATGHRRVAGHVLNALGASCPELWMSPLEASAPPPGLRDNVAYYGQYVLPWIRRRLTRRSSGDGRVAKYAQWRPVEPLADDVCR